WGKTKSDSEPLILDSPAYHPLVCHLIDVSLVAGELWDHYLAPSVRNWIEADLHCDPPRSRAWIRFLAGMHDIGKCMPEFQSKSPAFSEPRTAAGLNLFKDSGLPTHHGVAGAVIFKKTLESRWHMRRSFATTWAQVIGGHHGEFSYPEPRFPPSVYGDRPW